MNKFERHQDPKNAMEIGLPVNKGNTIIAIKKIPMDFNYRIPGDTKFRRFISNESWSISQNQELFIKDIIRYNRYELRLIVRETDTGEVYRAIIAINDFFKYFKIKTIDEAINFERRQDPKDAMRIGLKNKRDFDSYQEIIEWCFHFPEICTQGILKSLKNAYVVQNKYNSYFISPVPYFNFENLNSVYSKTDFVKWIKWNLTINKESIGLKECKCDIVDKIFNIINKEIKESYNFERHKDPKDAMKIGMKNVRDFNSYEEAASWCYLFPEICTQGDLKTFKNTIIVNKLARQEIKLEGYNPVAIMDINTYNECLNNDIKNYFPDHYSKKLDIVKWIKHNLTINNGTIGLKEAKEVADILFEKIKTSYVNESVHFERNQDPKDAMETGNIEFRKLKLIDEITKNEPGKWTGSSVLAHLVFFLARLSLEFRKNIQIFY